MHVFSFFQKLVILNEYSRQMIRSLDLILVQCNRAILIYCSTNTKYLLCCQVITVFTALLLEQVQTTITMMYKSNCKKCYSYLEYIILTRPFLVLQSSLSRPLGPQLKKIVIYQIRLLDMASIIIYYQISSYIFSTKQKLQ